MLNQYRDASNLNVRVALHERFSTNGYGCQRQVPDQLELPPKLDAVPERLASQGAIHISKQTGMFVARR